MTTGSFSMVSVDYLGKLDLVGDYLTALSARKKYLTVHMLWG